LPSDEIAWTDHLAAVFPDIPAKSLSPAANSQKLTNAALDPDGCAEKFGGGGAGDGRALPVGYGVRASTSHPVLWIEESGCWFAGPDGKPARVQGIVRDRQRRHAREEQLLKLSRHDPLTANSTAPI